MRLPRLFRPPPECRAYFQAARHAATKITGKDPGDLSRLRTEEEIRNAICAGCPAKTREKLDEAVGLALHGYALAGKIRFRYVKTAAGKPDTPVSNCILFRYDDPGIRRDRGAWRIQVNRRPDGKDLEIISAAYESARDSRTLRQLGARQVHRLHSWPVPVWADGGEVTG